MREVFLGLSCRHPATAALIFYSCTKFFKIFAGYVTQSDRSERKYIVLLYFSCTELFFTDIDQYLYF